MKTCSRCDGEIQQGWESAWPIYCDMKIGRAAQIFNALLAPGSISLNCWEAVKRHPAVKECGAQEVHINWHNQDEPFNVGTAHPAPWEKEESSYKLCFKCHDEFLRMVGEFLFGSEAQREQKRRDYEEFDKTMVQAVRGSRNYGIW